MTGPYHYRKAEQILAEIEADRLSAAAFKAYLIYECDFVETAMLIFAHMLVKAPGLSERRWLAGVLQALAVDQITYFEGAFAAVGVTRKDRERPLPSAVSAFREGMQKGGAVLLEENRRHLAERGRVVYLETSVAQQVHRVRYGRHRPLIAQGDHALALEIIKPGLLRYPASGALAELRRTALHRLMERYQQSDPFKFLIYAEQAGAELGPVG